MSFRSRDSNGDSARLHMEIAGLKQRLKEAESQLQAQKGSESGTSDEDVAFHSFHPLILLADSALPLGSFAYSSGLESFLSHQNPSKSPMTSNAFPRFLHLSILSLALTGIPYLLAAYHAPTDLTMLDNDIDASTPCIVARRASIAQGRALLNVWERSFHFHYAQSTHEISEAAKVVRQFNDQLRASNSGVYDAVNGHFAPLWGVVCSAMGLSAYQGAYLFLFNHAKAILSAGVRASVIGPYQAQNILASKDLQLLLNKSLHKTRLVKPEDAGQSVPLLDLWIGRHEKLYSRIFNS